MKLIGPTLNGGCEALATAVTLGVTDQLHFDLYDQDGATSDLIASCSQLVDDPFDTTASKLAYRYNCDAPPIFISFNLTPQ